MDSKTMSWSSMYTFEVTVHQTLTLLKFVYCSYSFDQIILELDIDILELYPHRLMNDTDIG